MKSVCIIPARGGSKRIPGKNIREFCGKPMIGWPVTAALKAGIFDHVIVSTDDPQIAEIARSFGATTPFMRPAELADDMTGIRAPVQHMVKELEATGYQPDLVCCLYATAPFVRAEDLLRGRDALLESDADLAFSVTSFSFPIQRALKINVEGRIEMFYPQYQQTRSQDLEHSYHDAAQFYWGRREPYMKGVSFYSPAAIPVILPRYRVQDIDTPEDWETAELFFQFLLQKEPLH